MGFRFEDFVLDPERRELRRADTLVALEPQVFDLLLYLVRNRERVLTRDNILDAIWNGRVVSESTLTSRINAARRAVGDTGEGQRLIRTVARKGVRFVGEVRMLADGSPHAHATDLPRTSRMQAPRPGMPRMRYGAKENANADPSSSPERRV